MAAPEGLPEAVQQGLSLTGIGSVAAAILYGVSQLIRAWKAGPNAGEEAAQNNLAEEVTRLSGELKGIREELNLATKDVQALRRQIALVYREREEARAYLNRELIAQGKEPLTWPPDGGDA